MSVRASSSAQAGNRRHPPWGRLPSFASEHGMSLHDALREARQIPGLGKAAEKNRSLYRTDGKLPARAQLDDYTIQDLIEGIMDETGY